MIVEAARAIHLAGASVFLIDFSYGTHKRIRDAKSDYLSFDIPVVIEIVDSEEKIGEFIIELNSMVAEGLVTMSPVRVIHYAGRSNSPRPAEVIARTTTIESLSIGRSEDPMRIEGQAQRITLYVGSSDTWGGRNLVAAVVEKCRELGLAGATASRGVMGFGKTSRIHRAHLLGLSEDMPERIEIVDVSERIAAILPVLEEMVQGGLIILEDVHVIRYLHGPHASKA
jgi:PII-like signaling protein